MLRFSLGSASITVVKGDITEQMVDAVVNAANGSLMGGGGVDGAIHRAGGPAILEACQELRRTKYPDGLPTGEAVATVAGNLQAKWVIHAVGPIWRNGTQKESEMLSRAYRHSLDEARRVGAQKVAFPSISTGVYGYPILQAAPVAVQSVVAAISAYPESFQEVRFVLFDDRGFNVYRDLLNRRFQSHES